MNIFILALLNDDLSHSLFKVLKDLGSRELGQIQIRKLLLYVIFL